MKHGNTAAETCKLNGWVVGTLLTGDEGFGLETIRITAIGEESVLAIKITNSRGTQADCYEGSWTFTCRDWVRADVPQATETRPVLPCPFCREEGRAGPDAAWYFNHASDCWLGFQIGTMLNCVSVSEREAWNTRGVLNSSSILAAELLEACRLLLRLSLPMDVSGMAMVEKAWAVVRKAENDAFRNDGGGE